MAKKGLLVLLLAAIVAGGVFAQDKKVWLSGEVSIVGAGLRGEYMLSDNLSLSVNAYWTSFLFFWNDMGANVMARYYFGDGVFYAGLGAGYSYNTGTKDVDFKYDGVTYTESQLVGTTGIGIVPEFGAKFKVGTSGLYVNPFLQVPVTIGKQTPVISIYGEDEDLGWGVTWGVRPAFGVGYTF